MTSYSNSRFSSFQKGGLLAPLAWGGGRPWDFCKALRDNLDPDINKSFITRCKVLEAVEAAVDLLILKADERLKSIFVPHIYATFRPIFLQLPEREHLLVSCPAEFFTTGLNTLNLTHNAT